MAAMEDIILQYTWPRIDAEVSKHRNHLLKAPFCVHPKTGRVCVPVDPSRIEEFDPAKVPTVGQLLKEIDEAMVTNNEDGAEGVQQLPGKSPFGWCRSHGLGEGRWPICLIPNAIDLSSTQSPVSGDIIQHLHLTSCAFADCFPPFLRCAAGADWEKTSLKPYVAMLDAHSKALMEETRRRKRGDKNTNMTTSKSPAMFAVIDLGCCFVERSLTRASLRLGW